MRTGRCRPGYDYLAHRKIASLVELACGTRMEPDLDGYQHAADISGTHESSTWRASRSGWRSAAPRRRRPGLDTLAGLDRQRHIETYLADRRRHGTPQRAAHRRREQRNRIITLGRFLADRRRKATARRVLPDIPTRRCPATCPPTLTGSSARPWKPPRTAVRRRAPARPRHRGAHGEPATSNHASTRSPAPAPGSRCRSASDSERVVPLHPDTLAAVDAWMAVRGRQRALPHPRQQRPVDFLFVTGGHRMAAARVRRGLHDAVHAAGLTGPDGQPTTITPHQLGTPTPPRWSTPG